MLDAAPPAHLEQSAQPVEVVQVSQPNAEQASQQAVTPVQLPTVSAPEAIPPEFSAKPNVEAPIEVENQSVPAPQSQIVEPLPSVDLPADPIDAVEPAPKDTKAERLDLLEQKLAEIVAREKPFKEERLQQNLKEAALQAARAGNLEQARQTAQDLSLSPETQAALLAEIEAIEAREQKPVTSPLEPVLSEPARSPLGTQPTQNQPTTSRTWTPRTWAPPSYSVVPPSQSSGNYSFNPGGTSTSGHSFQNLTLKGLANNFARQVLPGNGNLSLIFPLPIPVEITSGFGWRIHPVRGDQRFHKGVDLGAPIGTPVIAAYAGKVALADWLDGYGLTVTLSHNKDTQETLYAHLSEVFVKPGDWVKQGTVIGQVGNTGLSTGPHLHFEMRQLTANGWEAMDPGAQIEIALAQLVKFLQTGQTIASSNQQSPQITNSFDLYASVPPPPTEKRSVTHNF